MKKISSLLHILCVPIFFGITNLKAQPKDTPNYDKTGGWIHYAPKDSYLHLHNPLGPGDAGYPSLKFPDRSMYTINKALSEKLVTLRDVFKNAYPNPQGACITYTLNTIAKEKPADVPRFIYLRVNAYQLENDGKGGLNQLNVANDNVGKFTGAPPNYDGLLSVFINQIPKDNEFGLFNKLDKYTEMLKTKVIPNISGLYMMPPQNNFEEKAKYTYFKNLKIPPVNIGNDADKYTVFRFVKYFDDRDYGMVERHMDKIIFTSDGKLPYSPIKRKDFLAILKKYKEIGIEKYSKQYEENKLKRTLEKSEIEHHQKLIINLNSDIDVINKLKELNENELEKTATLSVTHKNIINDMWGYAHNEKGFAEMQIQKLKAVFIDDIKLGYTPCKLIKYYKSAKDEDFQTIMVNWYYELPVANNPKYNEHPSVDSRSFYTAIKNKLDWKKLEALLTK